MALRSSFHPTREPSKALAKAPASRGLGGLLGALDAVLVDAELLDSARLACSGPLEGRVGRLLERIAEAQGWAQAQWWSLEPCGPRLAAAVGELGQGPWPRPGVGPLGRSFVRARDVIAPIEPDEDCPRLRLCQRRGARWVAVLCAQADGPAGRLELIGDPPGGVGPERAALLRHLAWVVAGAASSERCSAHQAPRTGLRGSIPRGPEPETIKVGGSCTRSLPRQPIVP